MYMAFVVMDAIHLEKIMKSAVAGGAYSRCLLRLKQMCRAAGMPVFSADC